ncbi:hypothetical protein [Microcoleus anatoxicus]|uniref:Uncharacterized protein n=1 Tax=Microcoleus anatoxicus PTRS2 TaxID=2705321 RepID=A0ABU8YT23_9CYAN
MSEKNWFLVQDLGVTIDLDLVSAVQWNKQFLHHPSPGSPSYCTVIFLGTAITYSHAEEDVATNEFWIRSKADRERLYQTLKDLGLPAIAPLPSACDQIG